jgi:alkyl hydroperoxide reductase subunit F
MLDANLKTQLQSYMAMVKQPVELVANLDSGAASAELRELLQEIQQMSELVTLVERTDANERYQCVFRRHPHGPRVHIARARAAAGRRPSHQAG